MRRLYTALVSALFVLLGPLVLPLLWLWPRGRKGLGQRLGLLPREQGRLALVGQGSLWVHAASLGEVNAIAPVLKLLTKKLENVPLVITCTTPAGQEQARKLFPEAVATLILPLDLPWMLRPWIRRFDPRFVLVAETEFWPNFLHELKEHGAQVMLANGRVSEKSFGRYLWLRPLFKDALLCFDVLSMQDEASAERIRALGAKASRVRVTGNTKFDIMDEAQAAAENAGELRSALGLKENAPLIVAGSTRPGEEILMLQAFERIKNSLPTLKLLLAPRHIHRVAELESLAKAQGFQVSRRSQGGIGAADLILLDSLGELAGAYSLGQLAWIGGSWGPYGGQNPLEASAQGLPVLFGPHMEHFSEPAAALLEGGAALQIDASDLAETSRRILKSRVERAAMGKAGLLAMKRFSGAARRNADLAWKLAVLEKLRHDERDWRAKSAYAALKHSEFGSSLDPED
ncbi:MAG: glycosyltransferase N-terminal domain-containing protein [candidate division FCPU426 bacterium]